MEQNGTPERAGEPGHEPAPSGRTTLSKGQRTAHRILDAAEALFSRSGFAATSLRDIAAQAGIQQPGLYKHFASKEDLYRPVYERALKPLVDLMERLLEAPAGPTEFRQLTDSMTALLAHHPNIARLLLRAMLSADAERDDVALDWLQRLARYGETISTRTGGAFDRDFLALQVVAIFNIMFGYFAAEPLIASLTGKSTLDPAIVALQKDLLGGFVSALDR